MFGKMGLMMLAVIAATPVLAQSCEQNFAVEGTPMLTAMNFRTSQNFPKLDQARALRNLEQGLAAEGFLNVKADRRLGSLTAVQETSGSGRSQTLRIVARTAGGGIRVDAVFMIQAGQVADAGTVRAAMCRVVTSARG
jgi:hypothetical protein